MTNNKTHALTPSLLPEAAREWDMGRSEIKTDKSELRKGPASHKLKLLQTNVKFNLACCSKRLPCQMLGSSHYEQSLQKIVIE